MLISIFSFFVRPIASGLCLTFSPFYWHQESYYIWGVYYGGIGTLIFVLGLVLAARSKARPEVEQTYLLQKLSTFLLLGCLFLDVLAIGIYGTAFLPGIRIGALQVSAPGSQIFFAFVSVMTKLGVGLTVFCFISSKITVRLSVTIVKLTGFFFLALIFTQRGSLLSGFFIGLFLAAVSERAFIFRHAPKILISLFGLYLIISKGREIMRASVYYFTGMGSSRSLGSNIGETRSLACKISSHANQEHDQVWATLFNYTKENGFDWYTNLIFGVTRPFLDTETRSVWGATTSVDRLNIYNDAGTYLTRNFGFSISSIQYHYFSVGEIAFVVVFLLALMISMIENKMSSIRIDVSGVFKIVLLFQIISYLAAALDVRLKWLVFSAILLFVLRYLFSFYSTRLLRMRP